MGAAAEAATHDARAGDATLLGYVIEVVKLLAAHLVKFRHAFVGLVHAVAYSVIVTPSGEHRTHQVHAASHR